MTELPDTAEIRERWAAWNPAPMAPGGTILALCDALDAARDFEKASERWEALYARAEAAEAQIVELDRDDIQTGARQWADWAMQHEARAEALVVQLQEVADHCHALDARIAAVRAVLDAHGPDGMDSAGYDLWSDVNHALLP